MSLVVGYLLAELLAEGDPASSALVAPNLAERVERQRTALAGLTTKQRAATLVAGLRTASAAQVAGSLPPKVWQRLYEPTLTLEARVKRERLELSGD